MKVIVLGDAKVPEDVAKVMGVRAGTALELRQLVREFSGGEFAIVILTSDHETIALEAARAARPLARVVRAGGSSLLEVLAPGRYRLFSFVD